MPITLRRAALADAAQLLQMQKEAFKQNYEKYRDSTSPYCETIEGMMAKIRLSDYYLILRDGEPVGGVMAYALDEDHLKIHGLYVLPSCQNQGIAQEAFEQFTALYPAKSGRWRYRWTARSARGLL